MIRIWDKDEPVAIVDMVGEKIVIRWADGPWVADFIESLRSRSPEYKNDNVLYHDLPRLLDNPYLWAGHINEGHPDWHPEDYPLGPDDEVVQPESEPDLSEAELGAIQQQVERDIAEHGVPTDADLMEEIAKMNKTAPK
ncbi:MAG: hypothetical protein ACLQJ0_02145 [Steroidobacteraceae bacterium]